MVHPVLRFSSFIDARPVYRLGAGTPTGDLLEGFA